MDFSKGSIWKFFLPQDPGEGSPKDNHSGPEAGGLTGGNCAGMQPGVAHETIPHPIGSPGPAPSVISLQVTEGHRPPWKGWGRGTSGMSLVPKKTFLGHGLFRMRRFQMGLHLTQARSMSWPHPTIPANSNQTQEKQVLQGKKKVIKGHEDINYGVSKSECGGIGGR